MKVILQKDVKDLGKAGDLVQVADGYARNYLIVRQLAMVADEGRVKHWNHLQRVAESKRKKAVAARQEILDQLKTQTVVIKSKAGETDKLFGSVTTIDISNALSKLGYEIDRRDIHLDEPIRELGQHKARIEFSPELNADIAISVERSS